MATVEFYNVEHGDHIEISFDDNVRVIRDYGSYNKTVRNKIALEINNLNRTSFQNTSVILSHPHVDHYSGFELMYNRRDFYNVFDYAFVPWLDFSDFNAFHAKIVRHALGFIYYLDPNTTIVKNAKHWLKLLPIMNYLSKRLVGVYKGVEIPQYDSKVYWPMPPGANCLDDQRNKYDEMFLGLHLDRKGNNKIEDGTERLLNLYNNILIAEWEQILSNIDNVKDTEDKDKDAREIYDNVYEIIADVGDGARKRARDPNNEQLINNLKSHFEFFESSIDDHSIVFSVGESASGKKEDPKGALFLSDLEGGTMDKMLRENGITSETWYKLIKSSHHGTRLGSDFRKNIRANDVVHCCGVGNSRYNKPTDDYRQVATNVYYTSWWKRWYGLGVNIPKPNEIITPSSTSKEFVI